MNLINKLVKHDLVNGSAKLKFERAHIYGICMKGKQISVSFKATNEILTSRPLTLLHLNLFGPMRTLSLGGKQYVLVIVDDYSRFTWVIFFASKNEAFKTFEIFSERVQREKGFVSQKLEVTMEENLKMNHSNYIVKKMV